MALMSIVPAAPAMTTTTSCAKASMACFCVVEEVARCPVRVLSIHTGRRASCPRIPAPNCPCNLPGTRLLAARPAPPLLDQQELCQQSCFAHHLTCLEASGRGAQRARAAWIASVPAATSATDPPSHLRSSGRPVQLRGLAPPSSLREHTATSADHGYQRILCLGAWAFVCERALSRHAGNADSDPTQCSRQRHPGPKPNGVRIVPWLVACPTSHGQHHEPRRASLNKKRLAPSIAPTRQALRPMKHSIEPQITRFGDWSSSTSL